MLQAEPAYMIQPFRVYFSQLERRQLPMIIPIIKHLLQDAGIDVSYDSVRQAMSEAGKSGNFKTTGEAANDQELWCRAYEIDQAAKEAAKGK